MVYNCSTYEKQETSPFIEPDEMLEVNIFFIAFFFFVNYLLFNNYLLKAHYILGVILYTRNTFEIKVSLPKIGSLKHCAVSSICARFKNRYI